MKAKFKYLHLRKHRCEDGIRWVEVEASKFQAWFVRVFRPKGWITVRYPKHYHLEPSIMLPYDEVSLESLRQVTVWATLKRRPNVIIKNFKDEVEGTVESK